MEMSPVDRLYARITLSGHRDDGSPAVFNEVDVAVVPIRAQPDASTVWKAAEVDGGVARVLVAGPHVDSGGALVVPAAGGDLWVRITDGLEVQALKADRITILSA